jgi:hypothetical protein
MDGFNQGRIIILPEGRRKRNETNHHPRRFPEQQHIRMSNDEGLIENRGQEKAGRFFIKTFSH